MATDGQDFSLYAGDDITVDFTLVDEDGAPLDLSGCVLRWKMARSWRHAALLTIASDDIPPALNIVDPGLATLILAADDTGSLPDGSYVHSLRVVDGSSNVETLLTGVVVVYGSIT